VDNLPSGEPGQGTKQEQARQKWNMCALSGEALRPPIVICELGKLYNRSAIVEFLLGEGMFVNNKEELKKNGFGHITSIKNMTEVHLTKNEAVESKKATTNLDTTVHEPGRFICPVTQLETNGMHQFCALKTCGHVFSEKALNLFQELTACWTCNFPYTKEDVVPIYGNEKQVAELEEKLKQRLEREKGKKKEKEDKKRKRREEKEEKKEKKGEEKEERKEKRGEEKKLAIEGPKKPISGTTTSTTTTTTTTTTTKENGAEKSHVSKPYYPLEKKAKV